MEKSLQRDTTYHWRVNAQSASSSSIWNTGTFVTGALSYPSPPPDFCSASPSLPGVILYTERDYGGRCAHLTSDHANLGQLDVDDAVSSIRVNGDYQVRLFEHANYGGRYVEVNASNPNLDVTSLGEQFSSVRIKEKVGCDDERAAGVFLYSDKNYEGACVRLLSSESDLGRTAVGDNEVSSVRINGDYQLKLYEHKHFEGRSDEISKDEPDLNKRSLGEQYSSARINTTIRCDNTSQPGVYIYSEEEYDGSCAYTTSDIGDLDTTPVGNDGPRSLKIVGEFFVKMYEDRWFEGRSDEFGEDQDDLTWRSLGDQYSSIRVFRSNRAPNKPTPIYPSNGATFDSGQTPQLCWQSGGDPDGHVLQFKARLSGDSSQESEWQSGTCWRLNLSGGGSFSWQVKAKDPEDKESDWSNTFTFSIAAPALTVIEPLVLTPTNPVAGETVSARFTVKNTSGGVLALQRLGVGVHGPGCSQWECPNVVDFPWVENFTLQPDEEYTYTGQRAFNVIDGDYLVLAHSQDSNDKWQHYGNVASMPVSPGLKVVQALTFSPAQPLAGEKVTASYTVRNESNRTLTLPRIGIIVRGPNCASWTCDPGWNDFPEATNISIEPGDSYTYNGQRTFAKCRLAVPRRGSFLRRWPGSTSIRRQPLSKWATLCPISRPATTPASGPSASPAVAMASACPPRSLPPSLWKSRPSGWPKPGRR